MNRKKVAVIGGGYVGTAVANYFGDHFDITIVDPKYPNYDEQKQMADNCDLAVICVPTPMSEDGKVDTSIVEEVVSWLQTPLILIKSTIPPEAVNHLITSYPHKGVCFSPEFIGEGKYVVQWWKDKNYPHPTDMKYHDFHIVGGERETARAILEFFKKISGPECKYIATDAMTASLVKYMENSWGATKVTFCNEFAKIAEAFGVDYDEVRELWLLDGRVERMHTAVFKDNLGYSGKCYPKDICGIISSSEKAGYTPKLLVEVVKSNGRFSKDPKMQALSKDFENR